MDITSYLLGKRAGGSSKGLKVEVAQELPTTGEENVLYLVPKTTTGTNNVFEEYLYINNNWELIGTTDIDLSNYIQKSLTAGLVKNDGTIDTSTYITDVSGKEDITNKVTSLSNQSTDTQYPSAKCVYDLLSGITGGVCEIMLDNTTLFILDGKKRGLYIAKNVMYNTSQISIKTRSDKTSATKYEKPVAIILYQDYTYGSVTGVIGCLITNYSTGYKKTYYEIKVNSNNNVEYGSSNVYHEVYLIEGTQILKGLKRFDTLPQIYSYTEPNDWRQLAPKEYVDNRIQQVYISCGISAYSSSSTYAVGDYVYNGREIYKCSTAIETAEEWDNTHWTSSNLKEYLQDTI